MAENTTPEFTAADLAAQEAEADRKRLEARLEARDALLAMQQFENQAASPTVGPTLINRGGQPYSGSAMAPVTAPLLENPESVGPAPLSLPLAPGHGRMYMGPSSGTRLDEWNAGIGPSSVNLMPPPTGPSLTRLQELQALDRPPDATGFGGSKTLSIRPADPFSDASIAHGSNMMVVNARMQVAADQKAGNPSSPQTMMMAMGGGSAGMLTPAQAAAAEDRNLREKRLTESGAAAQELGRDNLALRQAIEDRKAEESKQKAANQTDWRKLLEEPQAAQKPSPAPAATSQRIKGKTYSTANGNFTWTGTGWKKVAE